MTLAKSHHKTTYHSCYFSTPKKYIQPFFLILLGMISAKCVLQSIVGKYNNNQIRRHTLLNRHFERQITLPILLFSRQ